MVAAMTSFADTPAGRRRVFYYAGHGLQLDLRNYLPVDAEFANADDSSTAACPSTR